MAMLDSLEHVKMSPSLVFKASISWPNFVGVGCVATDKDDLYAFSSNGYPYAQCHRLDLTTEAVRLNTSVHADTSAVPAYIYSESNCQGENVSFDAFYPTCRYGMSFPSGLRVSGRRARCVCHRGAAPRVFVLLFEQRSSEE